MNTGAKLSSSNRPLVVFAYAFPHRKTQDFLIELLVAGHTDLTVIGAPIKKLAHVDRTQYFRSSLRRPIGPETSVLCRALGLSYVEAEHDDFETISRVARHSGARMAIISGARILNRRAIDIFSDGVLNLHPGKLPQTAGLDSFYYSITYNVPLGVTAHFIDHRIDAGYELFFEETPVNPSDTPEIMLENNYQSQIVALRRFLTILALGKLKTVPIDRPIKNDPMAPEAKHAALLKLPEWQAEQYLSQQARQLIAAIEGDDQDRVRTILSHHPTLLERRTTQGWTPLIVACHHGRTSIAKLLLESGADPNLAGRKGTTPLMYAKTRLLGQPQVEYELLEILLAAGARINLSDAEGRDIIFYVERAGDTQMAKWLTERMG